MRALLEPGEGVLLQRGCGPAASATLRRDGDRLLVTDCAGRGWRFTPSDWWQAIIVLSGGFTVDGLAPVGIDPGRYLLALCPLASAWGEELTVEDEPWFFQDQWPWTDSGQGDWSELDRTIWEHPDEDGYAEFVLRRIGSHVLVFEYIDEEPADVHKLGASTEAEAVQIFGSDDRWDDPWADERESQDVDEARVLARRWWRGASGMSAGAAEDRLVESAGGRLVHTGSGDSPAALYGPEDLGPAGSDPTPTGWPA